MSMRVVGPCATFTRSRLTAADLITDARPPKTARGLAHVALSTICRRKLFWSREQRRLLLAGDAPAGAEYSGFAQQRIDRAELEDHPTRRVRVSLKPRRRSVIERRRTRGCRCAREGH